MKVVIITVPMMPPEENYLVHYPVDGNKAIEYDKPVRCPINGVLAKIIEKGETVKVIYILAHSKTSKSEENKKNFTEELELINKEVGAVLSYDIVEIDFNPSKKTYYKLITDLSQKIPDNAELYTDITYGFKTEILALFCALRFAEDYRNANVEYIFYGKGDFIIDPVTKKKNLINPMLCEDTPLYYLFKLMGTMGNTDAETALKTLKDFFDV